MLWANHPTGFRLAGGKVVHVNLLAALFGNRYLWSELLHMYIAGYMVAGFLIAGCYAFGRLRGRWGRYERDVAVSQPVKLAAIEGLYRTTSGAPEHLLGWYTDHEVKYGIKIPHLLSLLASTAGARASRGSTPSHPPSDRRSTSCASRFRQWSPSARSWHCWESSIWSSACGDDGSPSRHGSTAPW